MNGNYIYKKCSLLHYTCQYNEHTYFHVQIVLSTLCRSESRKYEFCFSSPNSFNCFRRSQHILVKFSVINIHSGYLLLLKTSCPFLGLGLLYFNTTFNNVSVISWQSVLLTEETESMHVPGENHLSFFETYKNLTLRL